MRLVPVTAVEPLAAESVGDLRETLQALRTLGDVLAWLRARSPGRTVEDIITQDEYTHDVVARCDELRWLAFDTN